MIKTARKWLVASMALSAVATSSAATNDTDQFIELFISPRLIHAALRDVIASGVIEQAFREVQVANSISDLPVYSDQDLKKILTEVDRITATLMGPIDPDRPEQMDLVRKVFTASIDPKWQDFFQPGSEKYKLAIDNRDFLIATATLQGHHKVLTRLATNMVMTEPEARAIDYGPLALTYTRPDRALIHAVLNSRAVSLVPNGALLQKQEASLLERSHTLAPQGYYRLATYDNWFFGSTMPKVWEQWMKDTPPSASAAAQAQRDTIKLGQRINMLANPYATGFCDRLDLNVDSLKSSRGDWTKVKTQSGESIGIRSPQMRSYVAAYEWGCHVNKDFATARKILDSWANEHHDQGKIAQFTHCKLALWARYGIGGKRDAILAKYWEDRAVHDTGVACQPAVLIDPRNPWADLS